MAVRIRMKQMGRKHSPYYRICAVNGKNPRGGAVLEELGTYDPTIADTDARAILVRDRVEYWLGVGAQPSDKVGVLIKKYGPNGTRLEEQQAAIEQLATPKVIPDQGEPASVVKKEEPEAEAPAAERAEAGTAEVTATEQPAPEAPAEEAPAAEEASSGEAQEAEQEAPAEEVAEGETKEQADS